MPEESVDLLRQINERLGHLLAIAVADKIDGLNNTQKVERLASWGLDPKSIASISGLAPTTVAPILSRMKKK